MKRIARTSRLSLYAVSLLLALTAASAADDAGTGPFGVTSVAAATARSARVGALFAADRRDRLRGGHFCTASVVHSPHRDLIVTAAHCLSGRKRELVFVPGYGDGEAPYGVWKVGKRFLAEAWKERRDEDSDVAFLTVEDRGGEGVEDVVGGNRFATDTATGATAVTVTAYLNAREQPVSCTNKPRLRSRTQQRIACPGFSGGSSGSPWVNGDGEVVGVLGGHDNGGVSADMSNSVVLGEGAAELYEEAERGSPSN
ncbi:MULTISPECIES: trypsin-like peptidase domain-containing protein [unclassified Streptomyces]|uniref:trypsin-like serine peptidase n=1 Tax=unclassified Streptomyces TaxID=2593676 RepID=UPI002365C774|nr:MULTISPECIES: trypsin-like peptidase domain-containing protein [unclassified Streptomyces]MDF3141630.1 trypsin-like peptidase domain-containing protein [Streptomyces sp. T21Q-yed]WDF39339.1 trypsin-like peptidase domain-containing protein [Streptomyces sp. T12]